MRAAVMRGKQLVVDDIAAPVPGPGEVLVKTLACGICGTDLHALKHGDRFNEKALRTGGALAADLSRDIVMGHEFCAEIVDFGPDTSHRLRSGTRVCAPPALLSPRGLQIVGYSNDAPGGYGEYMRLLEALLVEVPTGLPAQHAALTEPMAVGLHAVEKAKLSRHDIPLVIGCGPVGLSVVASLRLKNVRPIVAADFSPRRRELAVTLGADVVVDPAERSPYESWREIAAWSNPADAPAPAPWMSGPPLRPAVIFECVGLPGIIDQIMISVPAGARIIVVGLCMERDHFEPMLGLNKELSLQFVISYTPEEFTATLHNIAEGKIPADPLITGTVGVDGVPQAFEMLASPEQHAKVIVEPWR